MWNVNRSILAFIISFLCLIEVSAQSHIRGRVIDQDNKPIDAVLIWLMKENSQTPIAQCISDEQGNFAIETTKGRVYLMLSCLGYQTYKTSLFDASKEQNFKRLILQNLSSELSTLTVIGKKKTPLIERKAGKTTFNVSSSINVVGGNAFDLIRQLSGVSIQQTSKAILINGQGNNIILINGKQTHLTPSEVYSLLKSTSATNIDKIELISNASARYVAEGSGKVINIILKKEEKEGYNLNLNFGVSYWFNPKHNAELAFNRKKRKLNLYGNYSHSFGYSDLFYGGEREQGELLIKSKSDDTDKRNTISFTLGADYQLTPKQSLDSHISGNFVFGPGIIQTNNTVYDLNNKAQPLYFVYSESDYHHQQANRYNSSTTYRCLLGKHKSLDLALDFGLFQGKNGIKQPNIYYSIDKQIDSIRNYRTAGSRAIKLFALTSDYDCPLWRGEFSTGVKYTLVKSRNKYELYDSTTGKETLDYQQSNTFNYDEHILSAYLLWNWNNSHWSVNLGLRAEQTYSKAHLIPLKDIDFHKVLKKKHNSDYLELFPNIRCGYQISKDMSINLSYAKRIDRPVYSDLNPISQSLDGLASWQGNPFLKPQISHRVELAYQFKQANLSLAYTQKNNYFVGVTDTLGTKEIVMKPMNLGTQKHFEVNYAQQLRLARYWTANFSTSIFYLHNQMAFDQEHFYTRNRWAYNCSLQTAFPLFLGIKGEINASYHSRRQGGATEIVSPNSRIDLSLNRSFLDKRLGLNLSLTDVFWMNNWDSVDNRTNFKNNTYGYGESRLLKLNVSYRFGGASSKVKATSNIDEEIDRL